MRVLTSMVGLALLTPLLGGCGAHAAQAERADLSVSSTAFEAGGTIPREHSCDGADRSPRLAWSGAPGSTRSFVVEVTDPDAPHGTFTHWVAWDIPPNATGLDGGVPPGPMLPEGGRQGRNDFGSVGYRGPCPPHGSTHRYYFRVFALDEMLDLPPGSERSAVEDALEDHVVGRGELMGRYSRAETTREPASGSD